MSTYYFFMKLAEVIFKVKTNNPELQKMCSKFVLTDNENETYSFEIEATKEDLEYEKKLLIGVKYSKPISDSLMEFNAIHRKIADKLLDYDILLVHASAISINEKGILFTAPSGTGKSTHTQYWKQLYKNKVDIINDDKPLLKFVDNKILCYGSPWDGKNRLSSTKNVELTDICLLSRGETSSIKRISTLEFTPLFLKQIYISQNHEKKIKSLQLLNKICSKVNFYDLKCTNDIESARVSSNELLK